MFAATTSNARIKLPIIYTFNIIAGINLKLENTIKRTTLINKQTKIRNVMILFKNSNWKYFLAFSKGNKLVCMHCVVTIITNERLNGERIIQNPTMN
jgi:hypothetical protein